MALFKRLKKNIGIEEEKEETKKRKKETENNKEKNSEPKAENKQIKSANNKKVLITESKKDKEKITPQKNPMQNKNKADWLKSNGQLAVDVYQTEEEFCVQAPIAGVNQNNIDISIENELLIIKGERQEPNKETEKTYIHQECYWGPFSREIMLPDDLKTDKIKASLKNGILIISIPRSKGIKKKITIEVE